MNFFFTQHGWKLAQTTVILMAVALRVPHIVDGAVWFDEAVYVTSSRGTFVEMIKSTRATNTSPLFYPLYLWLTQDFNSTFLFRLPSFLAGVSSVILVLAMSKYGIPKSVALSASLLLAGAESQIRYSQEIREYELGVLVVALSLLLFLMLLFPDSDSRDPGGVKVALLATAAISPWVSYAAIIGVAGMLVALGALSTADSLLGRVHFTLSEYLKLALTFAASTAAVYFVTAKFQAGAVGAPHLSEYFPSEVFSVNGTTWALDSSLRWFAFLTGLDLLSLGIRAIALAGIALGAVVVFSRTWRPLVGVMLRPGSFVLMSLLVVWSLLLALSALEAYPFGATRQNLFAAPLAALGVSWFIHRVVTSMKYSFRVLIPMAILVMVVLSFDTRVYKDRVENDFAEALTFIETNLKAEADLKSTVWVDPSSYVLADFYRPGFLFEKHENLDSELYTLSEINKSVAEKLVILRSRGEFSGWLSGIQKATIDFKKSTLILNSATVLIIELEP